MTVDRPTDEWTPHAATWVIWPSAGDRWPANLVPARATVTLLCAALADVDPVTQAPRGDVLRVFVPDDEAEESARAALDTLGARFDRELSGRASRVDPFALDGGAVVHLYIGNTTVVVPTYGSPSDDDTIRAIAALFPGRRTVGLDARALVEVGMTFHDVTLQEPASQKG